MNTFEAQPDIQRKALQKALKSPNIGKHGKRKSTLVLEEVRKENAQKLLAQANNMLDIQLAIAQSKKVSPATRLRAAELIINRALGKPTEQKDVESQGQPIIPLLDFVRMGVDKDE